MSLSSPNFRSENKVATQKFVRTMIDLANRITDGLSVARVVLVRIKINRGSVILVSNAN